MDLMPSSNAILLRTDAAAGHGIGTALSARIEEQADIYAFLVDQLGMATLPAAASAGTRATEKTSLSVPPEPEAGRR